MKSKIITENGIIRYFDKEGNELHDGDLVRFDAEATVDGMAIERRLYLTEEKELGVDATNPSWIKDGRAVPCEYGIYPVHEETLKYTTLIKRKDND